MNFNRLFSIIKKEFLHIYRDKASLIIVIAMPIVFSLLFGYSITTEVDEIKISVLDNDKTTESRALVDKFEASNYFVINKYVNNIQAIEDLLNSNESKGALIINNNYSKNKSKDGSDESLLIIDGTDPTVAKTAIQSGTLVSSYNEVSSKFNINLNNFGINTKVWYNPNLESTKFVLPGLIGIIMQNITVILTAFSLVRERERGNIELLIVSPIRPVELIIGKMVPYIVIGFFDFLLALFFGTYYFNIKIIGSLPLLIGLGSIFVIAALSMGMLISTIAKNQLQAMQIAFITLLPSILLSGFLFPREAMPKMIQLVGNILPVTYFIDILRGIILKGNTFNYLLYETFMLVVITLTLLTLAIKKFHKTLD